ncbi:MAG: serine hydrolase [Okeania sp. SIO2C2]|uniref:serine hydrolase n=1 Tax=Okeania sp. SIO2C2 TaxID=2607787 RepID=UPI0013B767C9|nr:serine hydrolase [Okeania sp. SIO2C2]NEP85881.1 serine hydrolase [Okeania sp. SIO2C2]
MHGRLKIRYILTSTLTTIASITIISIGSIEISWAEESYTQSLQELYELRDRTVAKLESLPTPRKPLFFSDQNNSVLEKQQNLLQKLQEIEVQILIEQRANDNWNQALALGNQASEVGGSPNATVKTRETEKHLWQQAIYNLEAIPTDSFIAKKTTKKIEEYKRSLDDSSYQLNLTKSNFLEKIRKDSGLSSRATIAICNLRRECLDLNGNKPPASPASLIKVPIAVATMQKVSKENISLDTPIYVSRGNFTEDASEIRARKPYPLKTLVGQMIDHSSNIATNQLIDYLGQPYINKVLKDDGYKVMSVNYKLMGNRIMPKNPGKGRNTLTSNELTDMMVSIYNYEYPNSDVLIEALARQKDRLLGYAALEELPEVKWLGEKTGENSRALGTTLGLSINGEVYVITVIDSRGGRDPQIRTSINKVAKYLMDNDGLL